MQRSMNRILTTHVGSLVKTPEIIDAMRARAMGEAFDEAAFAKNLHSGVAQVVRKQAQVGIDFPSDGEFGKSSWMGYVWERLAGLEQVDQLPMVDDVNWFTLRNAQFRGFQRAYDRIETSAWMPDLPSGKKPENSNVLRYFACTGPIRYKGQVEMRRDIDNFKAALGGHNFAEAFLPAVAPCSCSFPGMNRYYKSEEQYLFATADALHEEYRMIIDAGLLLQVDDAILPMMYVAGAPGQDLQRYLKWASMCIDALNHALRGIPEDRVRYHICWGSQNSPHTWDIALREIVHLVVRVKAQAYLIEAANPRHEHEWQVWQDVKLPAGKILIPGVVTHSTNVVEHPELVALRLGNFARLVGPQNVIAGTDCGFSQGWQWARVHEEVQWAKLAALVEGAKLASQKL
jgi:5-methyltetrahydropteroyltriglutamate--homocysteine methyltransferase